MDAFTCKVHQMPKAPKVIKLLGDKKRPESAQHVIEFPGGAIEVSRTSAGYWAHIHINRDWSSEDMSGIKGAIGQVVASRIARDHPSQAVEAITNEGNVHQIAVLIRTK